MKDKLLKCRLINPALINAIHYMTKYKQTDSIYVSAQQQIKAFAFDERVAQVFEDMIQRSVPGYAMILELIGIITQSYVKANTQCYDLGCSLGASTLAIRHNISTPECSIIAVDNSPAMIEKCLANVAADDTANYGTSPASPITILCQDIMDTQFKSASLISLNFTLQFIDKNKRLQLLKKINQGMVDGGVLILSEKIAIADQAGQELLNNLHHQFKHARGYSKLEISQKRSALENVLIPDTLKTHQQRLSEAGFSKIQVWFQCFNFISLIAIK